jgi:hypothetical protein
MIMHFVSQWEIRKREVRMRLLSLWPDITYLGIVTAVVCILRDPDSDDQHPDASQVKEFDIDDDYQGDKIYVISGNLTREKTWVVQVGYGSCSGCDSIKRVLDDGSRISQSPTETQIADMMSLALHVVQGLREIPRVDYPHPKVGYASAESQK